MNETILPQPDPEKEAMVLHAEARLIANPIRIAGEDPPRRAAPQDPPYFTPRRKRYPW